MQLRLACLEILRQLSAVTMNITPEDFTRSSRVLGGSTVGQHLRHTLEFFLCFEQGYNGGVINYDKRAHDKRIETDKERAIEKLSEIETFIRGLDANKSLLLEVAYTADSTEVVSIETNAMRELVYNIEHAVHHMAIMKIGLRDVAPYVEIPSGFGIATSTIRYNTAVAAAS